MKISRLRKYIESVEKKINLIKNRSHSHNLLLSHPSIIATLLAIAVSLSELLIRLICVTLGMLTSWIESKEIERERETSRQLISIWYDLCEHFYRENSQFHILDVIWKWIRVSSETRSTIIWLLQLRNFFRISSEYHRKNWHIYVFITRYTQTHRHTYTIKLIVDETISCQSSND